MNMQSIRSGAAFVLGVILFATCSFAAAENGNPGGPHLTPVVIFPAFHFTVLEATVHHQTVAPECPASGAFLDFFPNLTPDPTFSQICKDKLLTLVVDPNSNKPMAKRFSEQHGVKVKVKNYGKTQSAPAYEAMYQFLEANGYERNKNIRVAGNDSRLTPEIGDYNQRAKKLIEETYRQNGRTPVHIVSHSNGPFYVQYLLTHTSQAWKNRYIHGFTSIAGNYPGQGLFYPVFFTGLNVSNFGFPDNAANAASSAAMYLTHPSSYMSSANPAIFGDQEVVVEVPGTQYAPEDNLQLFADANLPLAVELASYYTGFVKFTDPSDFPNVDVYAEKGSGVETIVGLVLPDLTVGQVVPDLGNPANFFSRDGDGNQEDLTNDAIQVWSAMPCYRFSLTDNNGVNHFALPEAPALLQRLVDHLGLDPSDC
jgi:lecithin-cholesterol acyltransferase